MFADKPGFIAGQMLLATYRCGGPSAVRTRTAAKRALSLPFVPIRAVDIGFQPHQIRLPFAHFAL